MIPLHPYDLGVVLKMSMPNLKRLSLRETLFTNHVPSLDLPHISDLPDLDPVSDDELPHLHFVHLEPAAYFPFIAADSLRDVELLPTLSMAPLRAESLLEALTYCNQLERLRLRAHSVADT
ncbi:hypothetical protein BD309DRAFT_668304 [Dichomitus squalens]|nr:hypothetical protein BD309DRAFT_668304 [Dichomitus squalens]